ncbi:hypothetical protein BpHYR1_036205 [Brachionus plicatilis]|uniref:Uncharacterized protein n=1 Tax=Brachionus plicatilis TaxID=10195 RepID=A0A3M7RJR8_BRAPC|nr:hypothetical protein BpHYR1_036205 [Brachionus plicatilis]
MIRLKKNFEKTLLIFSKNTIYEILYYFSVANVMNTFKIIESNYRIIDKLSTYLIFDNKHEIKINLNTFLIEQFIFMLIRTI